MHFFNVSIVFRCCREGILVVSKMRYFQSEALDSCPKILQSQQKPMVSWCLLSRGVSWCLAKLRGINPDQLSGAEFEAMNDYFRSPSYYGETPYISLLCYLGNMQQHYLCKKDVQ